MCLNELQAGAYREQVLHVWKISGYLIRACTLCTCWATTVQSAQSAIHGLLLLLRKQIDRLDSSCWLVWVRTSSHCWCLWLQQVVESTCQPQMKTLFSFNHTRQMVTTVRIQHSTWAQWLQTTSTCWGLTLSVRGLRCFLKLLYVYHTMPDKYAWYL